MAKQIISEEFKRMQKLAGLLNDDEYKNLVKNKENEIEEGLGKALTGAALAASLAGAPMKSYSQTPVKDYAKEKIAHVQDKVSDLKNLAKEKVANFFQKKDNQQSVQDTKKDKNIDAIVDSLNKRVGKIKKIGDKKYETVEREDIPSMGEEGFAERIAIHRAQINIASSVKEKEVPLKKVFTSIEINTQVEKHIFQKLDGGYVLFVIVSSIVD